MRDVPWDAAVTAMVGIVPRVTSIWLNANPFDVQSEGRSLPCMATALVERMAHLEGEAAKEEEDHSKDAIASAYAGQS